MKKLTLQEEEVMLAIWQSGKGFIKDFLDLMPDPKPPYTTVASTVRKLEQKGYVVSEKFANALRYSPKVREVEYKKRFINSFVNDYFKSSYKELVTFFVKDKKISPEELKEIINLIEKSEK